MKLSLPNVVILILSVVVVSSLRAEIISEGTVGSGYQGNLFNDSNSVGDAYAYAGMKFKYYPSASTEFVASAKYNAFSKYNDLSNLTSDLSFTIIPTPESSALTLSLAGSLSMRKFGLLHQLYNQAGATIGADVGYHLTSWAYWQSSVSYLNTSYTNSDFGSNRSVDVATGINLTVLGSNSLALRADYSRRSFDQPTLIVGETGYTLAADQDDSETFEITGVRLRYSRPLGESTGMNLSVGHRQLHVDRDYAVLGYTIDYLSPWSDLWEGASLSGGLKHFFSNQLTTGFSFAYYDKSFVDVVELAESTDETYWRDNRDDQLTTLSLFISRPVLLHNGRLLTPTINLGHRQNNSPTAYFDYADVYVSVSLRVGL